jgi:hypothetical protein
MKVEPGKSYRTRGGNTGVITDWYDTKHYVFYTGYIRYRDPGMSNLFGLEWDPTGKCMNYPPAYDLTEEIDVSAAPSSNTPLSNEKPTNPKDMIAKDLGMGARMQPGESLNEYYERLRGELGGAK